MDRKIEKKKVSWKVILVFTIITIVTALSISAFNSLGKKTYLLKASRITTATASLSEFQEEIMVDSKVESIKLVLVSASEGGSVEEIFVEDGDMVKKGDPIIKLRNSALMLRYMTQETAVVEQINNLQNLKFALEREERGLTESLIEVSHSVTQLQRKFEVDTMLYKDGIIAKNDFLDVRDSFRYQKNRKQFLEQSASKSKEDNTTQLAQINQSIKLMRRNLQFIHKSMEQLEIKAPVSGRITGFEAVIGEPFAPEQTIASIDLMQGHKIIGMVDEYYLGSVQSGQTAYFNLKGKQITLRVIKTQRQVVDGRFEIEMEFIDEAPTTLEAGLSLQTFLALSKSKSSVMIPKGNFYHAFGGKYVFVLGKDGRAEKRRLNLGRQNPTHYEVVAGLMAGETIITSNYEDYRDFEVITIAD